MAVFSFDSFLISDMLNMHPRSARLKGAGPEITDTHAKEYGVAAITPSPSGTKSAAREWIAGPCALQPSEESVAPTSGQMGSSQRFKNSNVSGADILDR